MPARPLWRGFLKISFVAVPVRAYSALVSGGGEIELHQIHAPCNSRIKHRKVCPIHGQVPNDEIVSGYEYARGRYVVVNPDELDKLRTEDDKAIKVDAFVPQNAVDVVQFSGRSYYLLPDGPVGDQPYAVIFESMREAKRNAMAQVVLHGREQTVLLRPVGKLLCMSVLNYEDEVSKPAAYADQTPSVPFAADELELTRQLIATLTPRKFDFAKYRDTYTEKLTTLVDAKVKGQEIASPPVQEQARFTSLMAALQASVAAEQHTEPDAAKPPKKMAASSKSRTRQARKRSS